MNKFDKMFKLIMESIDTNFHDLFIKIKNHEDKDLLINWVEAIEENNIVPDKEFTIDDMEKFEDTLTPDQLDKVVELGVEILQSVGDGDQEDSSETIDENTDGGNTEQVDLTPETNKEDLMTPEDQQDLSTFEEEVEKVSVMDFGDTDEKFVMGKCGNKYYIEKADKVYKASDWHDPSVWGYSFDAKSDEEAVNHFYEYTKGESTDKQVNENTGNKNHPTNHLEDHVKSEHEENIDGYSVNFIEFDNGKWTYQLNTEYNTDFDPEAQMDGEWYPPIDAFDPEFFHDSLESAKEEAAADIDNQIGWGNIRVVKECDDKCNGGKKTDDGKVIIEKHQPFSNFFPVYTTDGKDTGWRMGPTDFGGRKSKPMRCHLDPSHVIGKDEVIMINPNFEGQYIAIDSYYRAVAGDKELAEKLLNEFGLQTNLDV